ncbi:hypothetical protein H6F51_03590 [Cyanobacteria bacterium FACHB-DQ100]|nr:hypothetical protein [Cyanobacteria bacterium FACHB-DQ100]
MTIDNVTNKQCDKQANQNDDAFRRILPICSSLWDKESLSTTAGVCI